MAINSFNFETLVNNFVNNARSVFQGEVSGSVKFLVATLAALTIWTGVFIVSGWNAQSNTNLLSNQGRWRTLLILADEYRSLDVKDVSVSSSGNVDVPAIFAQISEQMQLGSRVNRIAPDGRNQSVEINRLYAEELTELEVLLASRGVRFLSAELRALPSGNQRLFTISAIIGPVS